MAVVTDAVSQALWHVLREVADSGMSYALMDGAAVAAWRHLRVTHDVDLLIDATRDNVAPLLQRLAQSGVQTKRDPPVLVISDHAIVPLVYQPPDTYLDIQIDLLLAETAFQRRALARRVAVGLPRAGFDVYVLSREDLILFKLLAGRILDRADVAALIRLHEAELDWQYLNDEAAGLGLADMLEEVRSAVRSDGHI